MSNFIMSYSRFLTIEQFSQDNHALISEYVCYLCKGIYHDPVVDICGHVFCKDCLFKSLQSSKHCPITNCKLESLTLHPIPFITSILDKQNIICRNNCDWTGIVSNYKKHIDEECLNEPRKCKYSSCNEYVKRIDLKSHEDVCFHMPYTCNFCSLDFPLIEKEDHLLICPKIIISCSCDKSLERCEMENHITNDCMNTIINCEYIKIGCTFKVKRGELEDHLKESHEKYLIKSIIYLQESFEKFEKILNNSTHISSENISKDINYKSSDDGHIMMKKKRGRKPKNHYLKNNNQFLEDDFIMSPESEDIPNLIDDRYLNGIKITKKNTVKCDALSKLEHRFCLSSIDLNSNIKWSIRINKIDRWLGMGVCERDLVINNKFKFSRGLEMGISNGCYLISSNGYSWNCNVKEENNNKLENMPKIVNEDIINFTYYDLENKLEISFKDFSFVLTSVISKSGPLVPCVIFLSYEDEITFII